MLAAAGGHTMQTEIASLSEHNDLGRAPAELRRGRLQKPYRALSLPRMRYVSLLPRRPSRVWWTCSRQPNGVAGSGLSKVLTRPAEAAVV
jgi:hypothetical protein